MEFSKEIFPEHIRPDENAIRLIQRMQRNGSELVGARRIDDTNSINFHDELNAIYGTANVQHRQQTGRVERIAEQGTTFVEKLGGGWAEVGQLKFVMGDAPLTPKTKKLIKKIEGEGWKLIFSSLMSSENDPKDEEIMEKYGPANVRHMQAECYKNGKIEIVNLFFIKKDML